MEQDKAQNQLNSKINQYKCYSQLCCHIASGNELYVNVTTLDYILNILG